MTATDSTVDDILQEIYGTVPEVLQQGLRDLLSSTEARESKALAKESTKSSVAPTLWDHEDVVLITYADQVRGGGWSPLQAQRKFLIERELHDKIRCVHLLPFCPFSSDDGFSVIDYLEVDPESGTWDDIYQLNESFDLMFDLVLNHTSQHHEWFQRFLRNESGYEEAYRTADPDEDLSAVVRPRSLPLLTPFSTKDGVRHVWTTFSDDQVDLNYEDPLTCLRMIDTLVEYARRGARIIRLDAIAFLWKRAGTSCIHLPETHALVRLMRAILDQAAPGTIVLTETNVPHKENISYFGDGTDEAHMVYQFSLPPLMLDAIHSGDTSYIRDWLATLTPPGDETTFFNFTASHDGVGVRPLEGLVPPERLANLVDVVGRHGGRVSMRANSDGTESPYELNITYLDAVADRNKVSTAEHAKRFLATQAIMLSMQGVPAVYFHSLVGSPNDLDGVESSGINRRINRHKYSADELDASLSDPEGLPRKVFDGYVRLLELRRKISCFHPRETQRVLDLPGNGLLGFCRGDGVTVLANLSETPHRVDEGVVASSHRHDVLGDETIGPNAAIEMAPFQVRWMVATGH
ncbi:MAG: sugar phosphorylase [Planctomycetota bacterium]